MNNLNHLHKLPAQKLMAVHVVQEYFAESTKPMPIAILLKFKKINCLIVAMPTDDTINCQAGKTVGWRKNTNNIKIVDMSRSKFWKECIGKNLIWAWQLINQQGYEDGVQFCFNSPKKEIIRQLIVKASALHFYQTASLTH